LLATPTHKPATCGYLLQPGETPGERDRGIPLRRGAIFKATRSIAGARVYGLWNRRARGGRPVLVRAQNDRTALLPPGFSPPGLLDALPDRHFDPLHVF
jgi:hypothetical protein